MIRETLDESIDRVATRLTIVPADPEFGTRLETRLERASFRMTPWMVAASMAAAVLVVAAALSFDRVPIPEEGRHSVTAAAQPPPPMALNASEVVQQANAVMEVAAGAIRQSVPAAEPVASIPALALPETLRVEELTLVPLTITPVTDLGLLELGPLELRDIDATVESKEY